MKHKNDTQGDQILFGLKLYIVNESKSSLKAVKDLKSFLEEKFKDQYKLEIIDILEKPQLALQDKILATPTVIKHFPAPVRQIIGDLSNKVKVATGLYLING